MLAALMASMWVPVEVAMCNEVVCPDELPMGLSKLQSRGPCSLLAARWLPGVEPYVHSSRSHMGPQQGAHCAVR
jgi:hypothetical protein